LINIVILTDITKVKITVKDIYSITYYTITDTMEITQRQFILSKREKFNILEIRISHRLKYFSYTYRISDKFGIDRPIVRWDNYGGQIHFDTFDTNQRLLNQQKCEYKSAREILDLVKIFKNNLVTMDISQL
jgi:hypothetical protein